MPPFPDDGISIPASYAAYLSPISSSKLHNDAGGSKDTGAKSREKFLETLYVVYLQSIQTLSGQGGGMSGRCGPHIQECWEFEHPRKEVVVDSNGVFHFLRTQGNLFILYLQDYR